MIAGTLCWVCFGDMATRTVPDYDGDRIYACDACARVWTVAHDSRV